MDAQDVNKPNPTLSEDLENVSSAVDGMPIEDTKAFYLDERYCCPSYKKQNLHASGFTSSHLEDITLKGSVQQESEIRIETQETVPVRQVANCSPHVKTGDQTKGLPADGNNRQGQASDSTLGYPRRDMIRNLRMKTNEDSGSKGSLVQNLVRAKSKGNLSQLPDNVSPLFHLK